MKEMESPENCACSGIFFFPIKFTDYPDPEQETGNLKA